MKVYLLIFIIILSSSSHYVVSYTKIIQKSDDLFPVSIIHMNDFHARFEETNERSTSCKPDQGDKCIGGYARVVTVVKELMANRTNPIYLNAGDNFQGTFWYNIGRWNVTSYFLNLLPADAFTLGNHEFDNEISGVVPFMETLKSPMLVANIDDTDEPTMQGKFNKSLIIEKYGRKIGIIGVILSTTDTIANTGKLKFINESVAIRAEATKLKEQGVNIIIVLSHCGLDVDYEIARNAGPDIDVIVGGHSHTFMYTGSSPPGPDRPKDNYPAVVQNSNGHKVLIVQASCYTKYIGDIVVYFDKLGNVVNWDGAPIFLDEHIKKDENIMKEIEPWKEYIDKEGLREIAVARTPLLKTGCNTAECNIGNFLTEAAVHYYTNKAEEDEWTYAAVSLTAVGGIRTTLNKGVITYADLITTIPFENTLDTLELRGDHLIETLEYAVTKSYEEESFVGKNMLQFSGLKVAFNVTRPIGNRVVSVDVLCNKCDVPKYEPLDKKKMYRIIVNSFLANGGDGFEMFKKYGQNFKVGVIDNVAVREYMARMTPIMSKTDNRLIILT